MTDTEFTEWLKTATPNQMMNLLDRLQRDNPEGYRKVKRYVQQWAKRYLEAQGALTAIRATFVQGE